jgi:hypothetical protein
LFSKRAQRREIPAGREKLWPPHLRRVMLAAERFRGAAPPACRHDERD